MRRRHIATLLLMLMLSVATWAGSNRFTLVIDAGHGGHDLGAPGAISNEKDINLKVALAFGKYVESNCPDVRVVYTRKTDVFIPLKERANIANRNRADLFISVHTNALEGGKIARGFETYTLGMHRAKDNLDVAMRENSVIVQEKNYQQTYRGFDPKSSESYIIFELMQGAYMERSVDLAKLIQRSVCSTASRPNKGVHQAGFLVLRETSMPSCLIELGFITTPDEEQQLNDPAQVDLIAQGIYKAFVKYKDKYQSGGIAQLSDTDNPSDDSSAEDSDNVAVASAQPAASQPAAAPKATPKATPKNQQRDTSAPTAKTPSAKQGDRQQAPAATAKTPYKKPTAKEDAKKTAQPTAKTKQADKTPRNAPVFKVQIFAGKHRLRFNDQRFKGLEGCESFDDGPLIRYTYGASTNYNEISRLRKSILDKFPDAFIIAFKEGKVVDVNEAIKEFLDNKKQK
ncbi:MAG: N-acetylmuramoyl-L-alanine amidase [Bacteroidales bacterium]|nr:N-acetylmuramoyl-L-alanine amidase [Bacteroidales bacterium]